MSGRRGGEKHYDLFSLSSPSDIIEQPLELFVTFLPP